MPTSFAEMSPAGVLSERDRVAQTVRIATADRRELESMCSRLGLPFSRLPSATLRQALRQHLILNAD